MNTQVVTVTSTTEFMKTAVQFAQFILRSEQSDDITIIREHGRYALANQPAPSAVWGKSIPAFGRLARHGGYSDFMASLREQDEALSPCGGQLERFEDTVAKLVYRHTKQRR